MDAAPTINIDNPISPVSESTDVIHEMPIEHNETVPNLPERHSKRIRKLPNRYNDFVT